MADRTACPDVAQLVVDPVARLVADPVAQLVVDHHEPLYRYAYRLTGSVADAEDLTQQVFLIAQQKLDQVRRAECVRGWLFAVLRNAYFKALRQRVPLPIAGTDLDINTIPAETLEDPVDGEQLQQAINTLSAEFKIVVLLFYFEERSYREIAQLLKIPLGTVMSRLARAKMQLRSALAASAQRNSRQLIGNKP